MSPTSERRDIGAKYANYFRHPSLQHYLILFTEEQMATLHTRAGPGLLTSRVAGLEDSLTLYPPGITLAVSDLFGDLDQAFAD